MSGKNYNSILKNFIILSLKVGKGLFAKKNLVKDCTRTDLWRRTVGFRARQYLMRRCKPNCCWMMCSANQ